MIRLVFFKYHYRFAEDVMFVHSSHVVLLKKNPAAALPHL